VNEIRILASVRHPNIIRYRDSFVDNERLYIITDFADHGDLSVVIARHKKAGTTMPEDEAWSIFVQLSLGLEYLHRHHVLHRDLKSSNVFLSGVPTVVKIGDLGVAKLLKQSSTQTQVGTPFYISPEIWRKLPYNSKSDVWSLGCVLYEMLTLRHPFTANSPKELSQKILRGRYAPIHGYSREMVGMVDQLLCVETTKRPSMAQLVRQPSLVSRMASLPPCCVPPPPDATTVAVVQSPVHTVSDVAVMDTIKVPRNLTRLAGILPPAAYMTPAAQQRDLSSIGAEMSSFPKLDLALADILEDDPPAPAPVPVPTATTVPKEVPPIATPDTTASATPSSEGKEAAVALVTPTPPSSSSQPIAAVTVGESDKAKEALERDRRNLAVQRIIAHARRR
jgi:NIMA (never in mitosis gene a)-related kinase